MEVGIKELKNSLSRYLKRIQAGEELTITDHGKAVALIIPVNSHRVLDQLIAEGLVTKSRASFRPKLPKRIKSKGTVSDLVAKQR